jgi:hypothetical protein
MIRNGEGFQLVQAARQHFDIFALKMKTFVDHEVVKFVLYYIIG